MEQGSPRFRQDLVVSMTEADGVAFVDVRDPKAGTSFRFYDFEYQLALQLNGQPVGAVIGWASKAFGTELTADGIAEFAGRLSELGFLETDQASSSMDEADAADSAEKEWMSPETAKTAQFDPDPAMLEGPPEPTPVVSILDLPPEPRRPSAPVLPVIEPEKTVPAIAHPPGSVEAGAPAAAASLGDTTRVPEPGRAQAGVPATPASGSDSSRARWALDLDGDLQAPDPPPAARAPDPPPPPPVPAMPAMPGATLAPASERRQPPAPEAVVMTGFSDEARAKAAAPSKRAPSRLPVVLLVVVVLLGAAAAVGYYAWKARQPPPAPQAARVRLFSPKPTAVYRWFSGRGAVTDYPTSPLAFSTAGRLVELLPPGSELEAGDVIGKLRGATVLETLLAHDRSRVGFYRQLRDSMRAAGNQAELKLAELRLAEKQRLVDQTTASLARFIVEAREPGEVVETLAKVGALVAADAPVVRVKRRVLHGAFELDVEERSLLTKLDFCRVEVVGLGAHASVERNDDGTGLVAADSAPAEAAPRFVDCQLLAPVAGAENTDDGARVEVALPADQGLVSGQPLRLARQRYDAVFPLPGEAVVDDAGGKTVWIAKSGVAEPRPVAVVEVGGETLVESGLRVGDRVIVTPPAGLRPGDPIVVAP